MNTNNPSALLRQQQPGIALLVALIILLCPLAAAGAANDFPEAAPLAYSPIEQPAPLVFTNGEAPAITTPEAKEPPQFTNAGRSRRRNSEGAAIIAVLVMVAIPFIIFMAANKRNTSNAYSQLAKHYGGTFTPGNLFSNPQVNFTHADIQVIVDIFSTGGQHKTYYTQIQFYFPQPSIRCEVYPEKGWSRVKKLFGYQDIIIGSRQFDDTYIIQGDNPAAISNLLTPEVQQQIEQLRRLLNNDDIYVSFSRYKLQIKKRSYIKNYAQLVRYTELAIGLFDIAMTPAAKGIEFVETTKPAKVEETVCQICGEALLSDIVNCRRCKTPHHRECWEYYGACSTYGCLERKYRE